MGPENNQAEGRLAPLQKVTPLSKYLALTLFIVLPFIGGWIGYMYAPEKMVEVEKTVEINSVAQKETNEQPCNSVMKNNSPLYIRTLSNNEKVVCNKSSVLPGADPQTFTFLAQYEPVLVGAEMYGGGSDYEGVLAFDKNNFYINGKEVYSVSDGTFELYANSDTKDGLYPGWIRLKNTLYVLNPADLESWLLEPMPDVFDLDTFKIIGSRYIKDSTHVYFVNQLLKAEPDNFYLVENDLLDYPLGISGSEVYYNGNFLEGISASSMSIEPIASGVTESFYIKDADTIYFNRPVCNFAELEKGTFEELDSYNPVCNKMRDARSGS